MSRSVTISACGFGRARGSPAGQGWLLGRLALRWLGLRRLGLRRLGLGRRARMADDQLAPDDLARGFLGEVPVPAGAEGRHQEHAVGTVARAVVVRCLGYWWLGVGVADLDEDPGGVAGQAQGHRLAGLAGGVDRAGDEFGDEELGALGQ